MIFIKTNEQDIVIHQVWNYSDLTDIQKAELGDGYLVDSVPSIEYVFGKEGRLLYTGNKLEVVYADRPLTQEEKVIQLEQQIADLNIAMAEIMGVM